MNYFGVLFPKKIKKDGEFHYIEGWKHYKKKNFKVAIFNFYIAAVDFNFTEAQVMMGYMHQRGEGGMSVNDEHAKKWYRNAADKDNKLAQYNIAVILSNENHQGIKSIYEEAMRYYKMAANQNYASAQYGLGYMYQYGHGVAIDQKKALKWYKRGAENDCIEAMYQVGRAYQNGLGTEKDISEALRWYTQCAKGGYILAQLELGLIFMNGFEVKRELESAISWLEKSNCAQSTLYLRFLLENKSSVLQNPNQLKRYLNVKLSGGAERVMYNLGMESLKKGHGDEAMHWFSQITAKNEYVQALVAIAGIHLMGIIDGRRNFEEAANQLLRAAQEEKTISSSGSATDIYTKINGAMKQYYKQSDDSGAIEKGYMSGLSCLGFIYHAGLGIQRNYAKAHDIYLSVLRFIDDEDTDANMCLGLLYLKGLGVEQNGVKAMEYFERSSKSVNTYCYNIIGDIYKSGRDAASNNYTEAKIWYEKGAWYKDAHSQFNLGEIYCYGLGVPRNTVLAMKYFLQSEENGCEDANQVVLFINLVIAISNLTRSSSNVRFKPNQYETYVDPSRTQNNRIEKPNAYEAAG